jgi:hypothetical protein
MATRVRLLSFVIAALGVALLSGCGSSSGTTTRTTPPAAIAPSGTATSSSTPVSSSQASTPAQPASAGKLGLGVFRARADGICRRANGRIVLVLSGVGGAKQSAGQRSEIQQLASATEQRLRRLSPPASVASAWQTLLTERASLAAALGTPSSTVTAAGRAAAATRRSLRAQVRSDAERAGVKQCGLVG